MNYEKTITIRIDYKTYNRLRGECVGGENLSQLIRSLCMRHLAESKSTP